jgi:hypothetical protein
MIGHISFFIVSLYLLTRSRARRKIGSLNLPNTQCSRAGPKATENMQDDAPGVGCHGLILPSKPFGFFSIIWAKSGGE